MSTTPSSCLPQQADVYHTKQLCGNTGVSLNALNNVPNRVAEIQTATTQILEENAEMKKSIEYSNEQIAALTTIVKDQATEIQKLTTELAHESKQGGILAKRVPVQNQIRFFNRTSTQGKAIS